MKVPYPPTETFGTNWAGLSSQQVTALNTNRLYFKGKGVNKLVF